MPIGLTTTLGTGLDKDRCNLNTEPTERVVHVKRTRAQVIRDKVVIRLATDETGPMIADVLKANSIELPGADWSRVFPNWLIATVDDEVMGCLMVIPGRPVSFFEFLYVKPSAGFKFKAIAIRKLILQAVSTATLNGSSYAACTVDLKNKAFAGVMDGINCIPVSTVEIRAKRLR